MNHPLRVLALAAGLTLAARAELPTWIDPDTGHRVVQLSADPSVESLYFTQYAFTAGGTKMVMIAPHGNIDVVTLATGENERVFTEGHARVVQTGRKTGAIFYVKGGYLYSLDPATHASRQLVKVPDNGSIAAINCDETLAAGTITQNDHISRASVERPDNAPPKFLASGVQEGDIPSQVAKHDMMDRRLAARLPCSLFTIDLRTGKVKLLVQGTDWLNHQQFSPTDPGLLIYAHEGRQWKVDRVWLIRADQDGAKPMLVHQRKMRMEIAVHEFWSNDGQWVWYDLQTPLSEDFWVGGYNVKTGQRIWYHLPGGLWMVHYNVSPDGTLFSGDGSDPVIHYAQSKDAKWMFLLRPELIPDQPGETPDQEHMIHAGRFIPEKLVNLAKHDYSLEPNGMFSPDGKWLIFRSNFRGPIGVFAVEVAKAR